MRFLRISILIILPLLVTKSFAANHIVDSLVRVLVNTPADTARVKLMNKIAYYYRNTSIDTARSFANQALALAKNIGDEVEEANAYNHLGVLHKNQGDYPEAMELYLKALRIRERLDNKMGLVQSYNNIGVVYMYENLNEKCLEYYIKAYQLLNDLGKSSMAGPITGNIGIVYYNEGKYEEAEKYYLKAIEINEGNNNQNSLAYSINNLGVLYDDMGRYDEALELHLRSEKLNTEMEDWYGVTGALSNQAGIWYAKGEYDRAIELEKKSLKLARELASKYDIQQAYASFSDFYEAKGELGKAMSWYRMYYAIRDSILGEERINAIAEMQASYENDKKQKEIEILKKDGDLAKQANDLGRVVNMLFGAGLFGLLIVIGFIIRGVRKKKQANKELRTKKVEMEERSDLLAEKNKDILDSIQYAKRLQDSLLPARDDMVSSDNGMLYFEPRDLVSGDFYWKHETSDDEVLWSVADCTGHGVPGAMVSVVGMNGLNRCVREFKLSGPAEILDQLDKMVEKAFGTTDDDMKDGMDIAIVSINRKSRMLKFAGANNPCWIVKAATNEIEVLPANRQPVGKFDAKVPFYEQNVQLEKGDEVYLFSDGFVDQFGGSRGKKYKAKTFKQLLKQLSGKTMQQKESAISIEMADWKKGWEQVDDICVFAIRVE